MGQRLPKRIISRRAVGTCDLSCDLSTGFGLRARRFVSAPVLRPSLSPVTDRAIRSALNGVGVRHQSTSGRVLAVRQDHSALF
jgi:hypothetical protein